METRANYALIGLFTLGVIASTFLFVFWFSGGQKQVGRKTYRIIFTGSVSGLSRGANVLFNGLRVGEVTNLGLMDEDPSRVAAVVEVVANTPVNADTHAKLEFTGLTGIASIALAGGGPDMEPLKPGPNGETPVIYGDKSDIQNLLATVQNLSTKSDAILTKADALLGDGEGSIKRTIANVETFSKALAENSDNLSGFLRTAGDLGRSLEPVGPKLQSLTASLDSVVKAVDPGRVANIVARVDDFLGASAPALVDTAKNAQSVSKTLADAGPAVADFVAALKPLPARIDTLAGDLDHVVKAVDPAKVSDVIDHVQATLADGGPALSETLKNAHAFSKALADSSGNVGQLLDSVANIAAQSEQLPGKLNAFADNANALAAAVEPERVKSLIGDSADLARKLNDGAGKLQAIADQATTIVGAVEPGKVRAIVDDATAISGKLNATSGKLDGLISAAQGLLGSPESRGTISDIGDAARSIKKLADNLDGRTRDIASGITRFTSQGLRQYETLAVDGRKTLDGLNRVVNSLGKNPSQVIFGGKSQIPEYSGN